MPGGGRGGQSSDEGRHTLDALVGLYPDLPVIRLDDTHPVRREHMLLVDDDEHRSLAWAARRFDDPDTRSAMDAHVVKIKRSHERAEDLADEHRLWDRRWVRISTVLGVLVAVASILTAIVELSILLSRAGPK